MERLGTGIMLVVLSACDGASQVQSSGPEAGGVSASRQASAPWQEAVTGLQAGGQAVYSFRFDGAPPAGAFYKLAIHDVEAGLACARYSADSATGDAAEFWEVAVDVNDGALGDHVIGTARRDRSPTKTANVTLLHRKGGLWVETYAALGGSVEVTAAPTPAEAKAGRRLTGTVEADFPLHAMQEVVCQAGISADGGDQFSRCTCKDANDVVTSCTPVDGKNCCYDSTSPRTRVSFVLSAVSCPAMCAWLAGLPDYCSQAFGP